jgi:hypothetical protein
MSYSPRCKNPTWPEMIVAFIYYITTPIWVWPFMICTVCWVLIMNWANPYKLHSNYLEAVSSVQSHWPFNEKQKRIIR